MTIAQVVLTAALAVIFLYHVWQRMNTRCCDDDDCELGCVARRWLNTGILVVTLAVMVFLVSACAEQDSGARLAITIDPTAKCKSLNNYGGRASWTYYCTIKGQPMLCDRESCIPFVVSVPPEARE